MTARKLLVLWLSTVVVGTAAWSAERPSRTYTIEELINTVSISGFSFSADGSKLLITSDESGIHNVYSIPVNGGSSTQLTHSTTDTLFSVSYFPNDDRFLFSGDKGGNERTHIFVRTLDGNTLDLTPGDEVKASFGGWAEDQNSFFIATNERDPRYFDLYEVRTDTYEKWMLFKNETGFNVIDVSPNKRYIALQQVETRANSHAMVYDRETGTLNKLMEHSEAAVCSPQHFTRDGSAVHCLTDMGHEFLYLVRESLDGGPAKIVERLDWDVQYAAQSKSGRYLVVGVNKDGRSEVRIFDLESGERLSPPGLEGVEVGSLRFSPKEDAVAFYIQSGRSPGDLFYLQLSSGALPRQLTRRLNPAIDPEDLVEPEVVRFKSYDGTEIPGILYKPHQASAENKVPALVYVHGGPGGQTRTTYNPLIQYLVNHGYAVYGINNRGSSGYGKTFFAMDDLKHGSADLDDCVASKQMFIDTGWVDPERIGIIGGSYGGYMVCAALAFRPEEFNVGVNIFGVTNWLRTLKSIPAWWASARDSLYAELGNPFEQEDYLRSISPLFHAENIRKPMIVLQGANDPRVLQVESDEMVAAVRANDVPVEYVIFPDEGHGFRKKANQIRGYKAVMEFLDKHL